MADKLTQKRQQFPKALSEPKYEVDNAQATRIKRPIRTKKIDLARFKELNAAEKQKKLNALINAGKGPLRLWKEEVNGEEVRYLRPRTWGQYLYETLWLLPDEKEARCDKVRAAIEMHIRPYLDEGTLPSDLSMRDKKTQATANANIVNLDILDRLHCRVYVENIDSRYLYGNTPKRRSPWEKDQSIHSEHMRRTFHGMTTVPAGLSIARVAPFRVKADIRIMTAATHRVAENFPQFGANGSPSNEYTCRSEVMHDDPAALTKYYAGLLEAFGNDAGTIVLEVQHENDAHWHAAYAAAKERIKKGGAGAGLSIMLVPLYRADNFVPSGDSRVHNQAWAAQMALKLNLITQGELAKPPEARSRHQHNDNDNDNDDYSIIS